MGRGRWIDTWQPEDERFWAAGGRRVAWRNLALSVLVEHVGFSVWSLLSVLVLFLGPEYGLDVAQKFLLVSLPTLVGAVLRVPYTFAPAVFGGRNWTVVSALLLLVPAGLAAVVVRPGVSYPTLLVLAVCLGVGGGNFASSMTNINAFFPRRSLGRALGVNAGGGNLGVAVVQLVGLAVLATAGAGHPRLLLAVYLPLIVLSALAAAVAMDNLSVARNDTGAAREAVRQPHLWLLSVLYVGTFGSFIGFSFAFGLVLQQQFDQTPVGAARWTFLGPLVGSVARPLGGWLADRYGGARVSVACFVAMAAGTGLCAAASLRASLPLFVAAFLALFVLSGVGNGSVYRMIPTVFARRAADRFGAGTGAAADWARRLSGAVIGLVGAIGALGGLGINLAFRQSFAATGGGLPAYLSFLAGYLVCAALAYLVYVRVPARAARVAYQQV